MPSEKTTEQTERVNNPSEEASTSPDVTGKATAVDPDESSLPRSLDADPRNRAIDRLLAAMGLLDDAAPLFASAGAVPRAGALLAIPALVASGVLSVAESIYGSLGPAFYGLRTTIVTFILLALLRIKRPEALKEHAPADLGLIVGLDRAPEVKTLRRKLTRLAGLRRAERFGRELARRRVAERGRTLGFLYVDGHVRVYHGKHTIPKAHVTRQRISLPATTDYWVNDEQGDPVFVVTAEANAGLARILPRILTEIRALIGPGRRLTIVFDRGGWSPKLFFAVIEEGFDILTYRKGRFRKIGEKRFVGVEPRSTDGSSSIACTTRSSASSRGSSGCGRSRGSAMTATRRPSSRAGWTSRTSSSPIGCSSDGGRRTSSSTSARST
jgi:hypothetical protein